MEEVKQGKEFPKDFDKQTQKYVEEQVNNVASQKAQDAVVAALPGVKMTLSDPMLRAAQLQMEADNAQADKQAREAKLNAAWRSLPK